MSGSKKIKICGLFRMEDIAAVNEAHPDYAGFIVDVPHSHRSVDVPALKTLCDLLDPGISRVGVFVDADFERMKTLLEQGVLDVIQLHGNQDEQLIEKLQPYGQIWRAFCIRQASDLEAACKSQADLVVLDAGAGQGQTFNWSWLKTFERPYFLAGGIELSNIEQALALPCLGVDLSSGAETNRQKDPRKIQALVQAVREFKGPD